MTASFYIDSEWTRGSGTRSAPVFDPATGASIGEVPFAETDLDRALEAAASGFKLWRDKSAFDGSAIIRKAAALLREGHEMVATAISREMGKPLAEARLEAVIAADHIDWNAEEGRRAYGRVAEALTSRRRC